MVEGYRRQVPNSLGARCANLGNACQHGSDILEHGFGRHPQSCDMLGAQKVRPNFIFAGSFDRVMRNSVDFKRQPQR